MIYSNKNFEEIFYYDHTRPILNDQVIELARGFLDSNDLTIQRRASSGVIGIYKSIEAERLDDLAYFDACLRRIADNVYADAIQPGFINGVRDDPKQVFLSMQSALWHSKIMFGEVPKQELEFIKRGVDNFQYLKLAYSQNISKAITLLSYITFKENDFRQALKNIDWFVNFYYRLTDDMRLSKSIGSSPCGDLHKTVGLLQVCMAGKEWIEGKRKREKLWSSKNLLNNCTRVKKGASKIFDRNFVKKLDGQ